MRCSRYNFITFLPKGMHTGIDGIVPMETYPFLCTHGYFLINTLTFQFFHHMQILDSENITGSHYRAGIVELIHVLRNYREMPGTLGQYFFKKCFPPIGKIRLQVFEKILIQRKGCLG